MSGIVITDEMKRAAAVAFLQHPDRKDTWDKVVEAVLALVPHPPEFQPNVTHYEEGDFSQMLLEEGPTITGRPVVVEPLLRMEGREIVGFQWPGKVPPEGGMEAGEPVGWQYFCDDAWRHSTAPERHREIGYPMRPVYASPIPARDTAEAEGVREALIWYGDVTRAAAKHGEAGDKAHDALMMDEGSRAIAALEAKATP